MPKAAPKPTPAFSWADLDALDNDRLVPEGVGFTTKEYAAHKGLSESAALKHVRALREAGTIRDIGQRISRDSRGRVTYAPVYDVVKK